MLNFSTLLGARVMDQANRPVGQLWDLVVPSHVTYPTISALVLEDRHKQTMILPFDQVEIIGSGIVTLRTSRDQLKPIELPADAIKLNEQVLDRQLVDIEGIKVVRANDITLGHVKGKLSVLSIDIGFRGVLRRMNLEWLPLVDRLRPRLVPWSEVSLVESGEPRLQLKTTQSALEHLHPADIANLVEELNAKRGAALMANLPPDVAADVLEEVDEAETLAIIEHLGYKQAGDILSDMSADQVADILDDLPQDKAVRLIAEMEPTEGQQILELISYKDEEAGGLMTTDYFIASPEERVSEVRKRLAETFEDIPTVTYIYVVEGEQTLVGVLSLRTLACARDQDTMQALMTTNLFTITPDAGIKEIAHYLTKYNLFSVAVTDEQQKLLGVVMIDDIMRELFPEA